MLHFPKRVPCVLTWGLRGEGRGAGAVGGGTLVSVVISADCPVVCAVIAGLSGHCPSAVGEMHNNSGVKCSE